MTTARPISLAFLAWAFLFVAFGGTTLLANTPSARAVGVVVFAVPMVLWAAVAWRRASDRLDVAVLLAAAAHLAVSLLSQDPAASLEMSAVVVVYACVYGFARWTAARPELRRMLAMAVVVALLFWLTVIAVTWIWEKVAAVQQLGWPPPTDPFQPWVWGSVNTPPVLALLAGPFIAWLPADRVRRGAVVLWLATSAVVVPLSLGRAGWLGIAVALVSAEVMLGFPVMRRFGVSARSAPRVGTAVGAAVVGLVGLTAVAGGLTGIVASLDSRLRLWAQALSLFGQDPVTGAGPSTFGWARFAHVPDYVDRVAARDVHSIPLQTLSDGGIVLGIAVVVLAGAWVSLLARDWSSVDRRQRFALAAVIGYAAFALLDDLSFLPSITVLLIVLAAWSLPVQPAALSRRSSIALVPLGLLLLGLAAAPSTLAMTTSRLAAAEGRAAAVAGEWSGAANTFRRAVEAHPTSALLWMSVGLAEARAGATQEAVDAYERARDLSPGDPRPWGALAALATSTEEKVELLDQAARRSNDPRYAYRLGVAQRGASKEGAAALAFAHAVALWPDWLSVVPAAARPEVRAVLPDVVAQVGSIGGAEEREALWNAALATGDLPPGAAPAWQAVAMASTGDIDGAQALLAEAPSSSRTDEASAAVAWMACDEAAVADAEARLLVRPAPVLPGDHPVLVTRSGAYRELEIGDYQPITVRSVPKPPPWPQGLVEAPNCG